MYQAYYRKYRPNVFDDVCGQEHITSVLKYQTETGRISHAYLFCGSRGTGKTTCAKILAKAVNCESPHNGNPCGVCESCRAIEAGVTTDVLEMDAASNNGVDYIRDIRDAVAYTPAMLKKRVYIIDEVHMLSLSAFNALLKTLEEPPAHVVFVLATTEMHKLPATIISRCQRFDFRRISLSVLSGQLCHIAEQENIVLEDEAAQRIARQAQGGMRDAISLFELCSGGGANVTVQRVEEILGLSNYEFMHDTVCELARGNSKALFSAIAEVVNSSKDISVFWGELASFYRDMMIAKYSDDPLGYLDLTEQEYRLLTDAAEKFPIKLLTYHCAAIDNAMNSMQRMPAMKRTIAEFACIRMCEPQLEISPEALSARIGQLEDKIAMLEVGSIRSGFDSLSVSAGPVEDDRAVPMEQPLDVASDKNTQGKSDSGTWIPVSDVSDFLEKLSTLNKQAQSFMTTSDLLISENGDACLIRCENDFAKQMLSRDAFRDAIVRALMLSRIVSAPVFVHVEMGRVLRQKTSSAANELFE